MLPVLRCTRVLRFTRPGSLLPWMGPALRGLLARPFKERVCKHPLDQQQSRWLYCTGCPYGQTIEPDPPPGAAVFHGQGQAARPVVLELPFPMPHRVRPGDTVPITLTFIGPSAITQAAHVWQALAEAGDDPRRGFDPERTTFTLATGEQQQAQEIELPSQPGAETIASVRVRLTGPLFLRNRDNGRRHHIAEPSFADLLRASLRTLGTLFALYDRPLPADFAALKQAALAVPMIRAGYTSFHQPHYSNRSRSNRPLHGVLGGAIYGPLPAALLPWLQWGGTVHVGTDRVAGAGGWHIDLPLAS